MLMQKLLIDRMSKEEEYSLSKRGFYFTRLNINNKI